MQTKSFGLNSRLILLALATLNILLVLPYALAGERSRVVRAAAPEGVIRQVMVINLENENFLATFSPTSPATYLNNVLLPQGELITNYFATSHVSLGNYLSQVSGQETNPTLNNDCINLATLAHPPVTGSFNNIVPGTDASDASQFPGQVVGDGCVFPAPTATSHGAQTIGDQLDRRYARRDDDDDYRDRVQRLNWRGYMEDMGKNPARDYGTPDPLGGTDCAHAPIDGVDNSNTATPDDQYATRHNPFVYFHSVIDDNARCNSHVVPLGTLVVGQNGAADTFSGHLYEDLQDPRQTPRFMFVTPNLCNDGHDATCMAPNVEGTFNSAGRNAGGLVAADLWLKHWMPMILNSPAYKSGQLLVVITFDEAGFADARACEKPVQSDCNSPTGPNVTNPGFSPLLGMFRLQTPPTAPFQYAGGGQVGAVLFHKFLITPGTVNSTGSYNHYSALRSYEDLLGLRRGGDDGFGHIGYAATPGLLPFGRDVFNATPPRRDDD